MNIPEDLPEVLRRIFRASEQGMTSLPSLDVFSSLLGKRLFLN